MGTLDVPPRLIHPCLWSSLGTSREKAVNTHAICCCTGLIYDDECCCDELQPAFDNKSRKGDKSTSVKKERRLLTLPHHLPTEMPGCHFCNSQPKQMGTIVDLHVSIFKFLFILLKCDPCLISVCIVVLFCVCCHVSPSYCYVYDH